MIKDTIKIKKDGIVKVELVAMNFKDDGDYYVYSPSLDLLAAGETEAEASENFIETAKLYFEFGVQEGTIEKDLKKLGWMKHRRIKSRYQPPAYTPAHVGTIKGFPNFQIQNQSLAVYA